MTSRYSTTTTKAFQCPECGDAKAAQQSAAECCSRPELHNEAWQCPTCESAHAMLSDAVWCCLPRIADGYACGECEDFHPKHCDADSCCADIKAEVRGETAALFGW